MRRAGALLVLAAAVGVLISVGGGLLGQAHAADETCIEHTKRVVKHVKRHGKRIRIVRPKHYRTCEEAPASGAPAAPVSAPSAASPSAAPPSAPAAASPSTPLPTPVPTPVAEVPQVEPPPPAEPEPNAVGVTADDHALPYTYRPSRTQVRPGRLTVQLDNRGDDAHNMYMEKVGTGGEVEGEVIKVSTKTEPASQTTKSVEVEAGTYRMWCTFENGKHAEDGMETHITVTG